MHDFDKLKRYPYLGITSASIGGCIRDMPNDNHHRSTSFHFSPTYPQSKCTTELCFNLIISTGSAGARNIARVHFMCADQISFDMIMRYAVADLRSLHTHSDIPTVLTLRDVSSRPRIMPAEASLQKWGSQAKNACLESEQGQRLQAAQPE